MPLRNEDIPALCQKWANGNAEAAAFLENFARIVRLADDIADGDAVDPVASMAELLMRLFSTNNTNPFYQANITALNAPIANAVILWVKSEDWRRSDHPKTRLFGFVAREAVEQVYYTVATLTGGYVHALRVAEEMHVLGPQASPETLAEWEAE